MESNGVFKSLHIYFINRAKLAFKSNFIGGHYLVSHCFATLPIDRNQSFTRVLTASIASKWYYYYYYCYPCQIYIRRVVTNNYGWPSFANFGPYCRIKLYPPCFTAFYYSYPLIMSCTTLEPESLDNHH